MKFTRIKMKVVLDVEDENFKISAKELDQLGAYMEEGWLGPINHVCATPIVVATRQIELDEDDEEVKPAPPRRESREYVVDSITRVRALTELIREWRTRNDVPMNYQDDCFMLQMEEALASLNLKIAAIARLYGLDK